METQSRHGYAAAVCAATALEAAPKITISNDQIAMTVLLPDPSKGFYRGLRFDWGGMIASLRHCDQEFYGLWFDRISPKVTDFVFEDGCVTVGCNTAALGPADSFDPFEPIGWRQAAPGGVFAKIGVGLLRKPEDNLPYSAFREYDLIDGGSWDINLGLDFITFTHTVGDVGGAIAYVYRKELRLRSGAPVLEIRHALENRGAHAFTTTTFNHNFLTLGGEPTAQGVSALTTFPLTAPAPLTNGARLDNAAARFERPLESTTVVEAVFTVERGKDPYDVQVLTKRGAGFRARCDLPLSGLVLWAISRTVSLEPYVELSVPAGERFDWTYVYSYSVNRTAI